MPGIHAARTNLKLCSDLQKPVREVRMTLRMPKNPTFAAAISLPFVSSLAAIPCEELKAEIAAKIDAKGARSTCWKSCQTIRQDIEGCW